MSEKNRASVAVESEVSIQALKVQNRTWAENYRLRKKNESELSREKYFSRNQYYVNDYKKRQIESGSFQQAILEMNFSIVKVENKDVISESCIICNSSQDSCLTVINLY